MAHNRRRLQSPTWRCTAGSRTTPPALTCSSSVWDKREATWAWSAQSPYTNRHTASLHARCLSPKPIDNRAPTCSLPASNCGLISTTASPSGHSTSHTCRQAGCKHSSQRASLSCKYSAAVARHDYAGCHALPAAFQSQALLLLWPKLPTPHCVRHATPPALTHRVQHFED